MKTRKINLKPGEILEICVGGAHLPEIRIAIDTLNPSGEPVIMINQNPFGIAVKAVTDAGFDYNILLMEDL